MTLITDSGALQSFCARQASVDYIAVDTEFLRDNSYWPKLCLVQVAGPQDAAVIDVLAPGIETAPLLDLMRKPDLIKVFHSARQDLELFFYLLDEVPAPLFDTQVAAMVCGFGDSIGYDGLVRRLIGKQIDMPNTLIKERSYPKSKCPRIPPMMPKGTVNKITKGCA